MEGACRLSFFEADQFDTEALNQGLGYWEYLW
jgi:hypothetical protein